MENSMRSVGIKWGALTAVAAALVACGGGSSSQDQDRTEPASVAMSGVVAKGPASGARVTIFRADGTVAAGPITTGAGGTYSARVMPNEGPFRVEVDLNGADIQDDLDPSRTYKGKAGEMLRAVVLDVSASRPVNVTPFSDLAAELALTSVNGGRLNAAAVDSANKKVSQILGALDFLAASPTGDAMLQRLKAVQQMVEDQGDLGAVLTSIRDAARVGDGGAIAIDGDLMDSLAQACATAGVSTCDSAFAPRSVAEAEVTPTQINAIEAAKTLFQDLRNTLLAYSNDQGDGELDQAGDRINAALSAAVKPIDDEQLKSLAMANDADEMFRAFKAGTSSQRRLLSSDYAYGRIATRNADGSTVEPNAVPKFACEVGRATIIQVDGRPDVSSDYTAADDLVTPANANVISCYGIGTVGRLVPGRGDGYGYFHSLLMIPQPGGQYAYVHQLRRQAFDRTVSSATSRVRAVYGSLTMTRDADQALTGFTVNGRLIPGFKGHAPGEYATLDRVDASLTMSGNNGTATSSLNVTGSMALMKLDGTQASRVDITSGSFAGRTDIPRSYYDNFYVGEGSCPAGYGPVYGTSSPFLTCGGMVEGTTGALGSMSLNVSVTAPGVRFQGIASAAQPSFDSTGSVYYPTVLSLQGLVSEADGPNAYRVLLDGTVTARLLNFASHNASSNQPAPMEVGFNGRLLLKDRPAMGFTFAGARDAADNRSGSGTFFWNNRVLRFEGDADTRALTVRNDDGLRFTIPQNGSRVYQPVYRGDIQVGRINVDLARIEYADGTYEQY